MVKNKARNEAALNSALDLISRGRTYAEAAVRTNFPYWIISGSIRKIYIAMLYEEKDRIEEFAQQHNTTASQVIMDLVNMFWDDYVKRVSRRRNQKKRKIRAAG